MSRLLWAIRLVLRIVGGLLLAAAIAIALTMPAPAFNERFLDQAHVLCPLPAVAHSAAPIADIEKGWAKAVGPCSLDVRGCYWRDCGRVRPGGHGVDLNGDFHRRPTLGLRRLSDSSWVRFARTSSQFA